MEYDSDEERRMFCSADQGDEEEYDMESEYSSAGEGMNFLRQESDTSATSESKGTTAPLPLTRRLTDDEEEKINRKSKTREKLFSSSTSSSSCVSVEGKEQDRNIFTDQLDHFTDGLISSASMFLSSSPSRDQHGGPASTSSSTSVPDDTPPPAPVLSPRPHAPFDQFSTKQFTLYFGSFDEGTELVASRWVGVPNHRLKYRLLYFLMSPVAHAKKTGTDKTFHNRPHVSKLDIPHSDECVFYRSSLMS